MNKNKYEVRRNEVHETLNRPIHKFINFGNALIAAVLIIFIVVFNYVRINQHIEHNCFIISIIYNDTKTKPRAKIVLQSPLNTFPNLHNNFNLSINGQTTKILIDSIDPNRRVLNCRILTYKRLPKIETRNGVFAIFSEQKDPVTFFQIFYRRLIHL
jgi:hypothetical protein